MGKPDFAIMFGGPGAKHEGGKMNGFGEPEGGDEGGGMDGARKSAVAAIAKALGARDANLDSLDSALQAYVEACDSDDYGKDEPTGGGGGGGGFGKGE